MYKNIYSFDVLSELNKLNEVYVLDRKTRCVLTCSRVTVSKLLEILRAAYGSEGERYIFWQELEEDEK